MTTNRIAIIATSAALACAATFAIAQSSAVVRANSPFAGTWQGKLNGLPGIELKIDEAGGKIGGVVVFYFQERPGTNSPWRVTAEYPVPLLAPRVDGKTLTFEVEHHICHTCTEIGPDARFRVELAGPNDLRLWKLNDRQAGKDLGPGVKLTRRIEPAGLRSSTEYRGPLVSVELRLAVDWGRTPAFLRAFRLTLP